MRETNGKSIGNGVVKAPGPARVRDSVEGTKMLSLLLTIDVKVGFSDVKVGGMNT